MSTRPLISETKLAVGSLIPGVPFLVFDEQVYTGLTAAQVTTILSQNEVRGAHNVVSDVVVRGLHTITLHQIRIKNASDAALRPSWSSVDAAELAIQSDASLAVTKRDSIYTGFSAPLSGVIGQTIDSLTAAQHRSLVSFYLYMGGRKPVTDGKGKILPLSLSTQAPIEYHYTLDFDSNDWLLVSVNPNWADFIS